MSTPKKKIINDGYIVLATNKDGHWWLMSGGNLYGHLSTSREQARKVIRDHRKYCRENPQYLEGVTLQIRRATITFKIGETVR